MNELPRGRGDRRGIRIELGISLQRGIRGQSELVGHRGVLDRPVFPADSLNFAEVTGIQGRYDAVMATRRGCN